jgi:hypothetical protein
MSSKIQSAVEKKQTGRYNCAQAVACSFCEHTQLDEETMRQASVNLDDVFQKKAKKKATKSGASARSRKPPVDTSLPWANKF